MHKRRTRVKILLKNEKVYGPRVSPGTYLGKQNRFQAIPGSAGPAPDSVESALMTGTIKLMQLPFHNSLCPPSLSPRTTLVLCSKLRACMSQGQVTTFSPYKMDTKSCYLDEETESKVVASQSDCSVDSHSWLKRQEQRLSSVPRWKAYTTVPVEEAQMSAPQS
jgi:hypothetical protein